MFNWSSKLQGRVDIKAQKKWRLFYATDFESLMCPSFTFCHILGIFPYKINASGFEISKPRYILSTIIICVCLLNLLCILYMIDFYEPTTFKSIQRIFERNCFFILTGFVAVVTYILSGPRMRLFQTIMEISLNLPPKLYQKLSRLIHAKDILGSIYLFMDVPIYWHYLNEINIPTIRKISTIYLKLLTFHMDMQYMNCVCVLKACFKRINDNLEHIRKLMMKDDVYHLGRMSKQRNPFLLIKLKTLRRQHLMINNAVEMLNMIFSLQLLSTITLTFGEITFQLYFYILYWLENISVMYLENDIYKAFLIASITYNFVKIILIVWACETGKNQALQIGTAIHDVLNSTDDNEIKNELQLFSLQILHRKNTFSARSLTVDARLLTAMVGNISTYLLILIQFVKMPCSRQEITTNITNIYV